MGRQNLTRVQIGDADAVLELLWLLFTTVQAAARSHQDLVLENLLLRHQLAVLTRPTRRRPHARLRLWDKLLWILARRFCAGWRQHLSFVTPETVVRWHRQGWRLFWRWKSRSRGGRPHLSHEVRDLIATISRDNRLWGTERIRGELLKLGIVVSNRSIRRYRWRGPGRAPTQTWRTFLRNHAHHLWAADLLSVPTLTFTTLYVLVFIAHGRRELVHINVTANPTAAWVWRQIIEATPWGHKPRHLLHDRDAVYGRDFRKRAAGSASTLSQRRSMRQRPKLAHLTALRRLNGWRRHSVHASGCGAEKRLVTWFSRDPPVGHRLIRSAPGWHQTEGLDWGASRCHVAGACRRRNW